MRKPWSLCFLLLMCLIIVACGNDPDEPLSDRQLLVPTDPIEELPVENESLTIEASRDYRPPDQHNFTTTLSGLFIVKIPQRIPVTAGNTGTGWLSLLLGDQKFCYKGNAKDQRSLGLNFVLKKEMVSNQDKCFSNKKYRLPAREVILHKGQIIKATLIGGGCASDCRFTKVYFTLDNRIIQ